MRPVNDIATGLAEQTPTVGQGIAINITRSGAIQGDRLVDLRTLVCPRMGDGRAIECAERYCIRGTVHRAIMDHQLHDVVAKHVNRETGGDTGRVGERRSTGRGRAEKRPLIGQGIPVDVRRPTAIERHRRADLPAGVRPSLRTRCAVTRGDHDGVRATETAVTDRELGGVSPGFVNDKRWGRTIRAA